MADFDSTAQDYSQTIGQAVAFSGQEHAFFLRVKADLLAGLLDLVGLHGVANVLDVGCGVGLLDNMLQGSVASITGVDVSRESLAKARTICPKAYYIHYDGTNLPFTNASFDLAFAVCVLHHVSPAHWQYLLNEMVRTTRPGGLVVIMEHNPWNPLTRWVVSRVPFDADAVLVRPGQAARLLSQAGLVKVRVCHFLFTPFDHPMARRLDGLLSWFPLGAQYLAIGHVPG